MTESLNNCDASYFKSIYGKYKKSKSLEGGEKILAPLLAKKTTRFSIERVNIKSFFGGSIKGHKILVDEKKAFFPKIIAQTEQRHKEFRDARAAFFSVGLVFPSYIPLCQLIMFSRKIMHAKDKEKLVGEYLTENYCAESISFFDWKFI